MKSLGGEHDARFHELLVELPHVGEQLLARHHARLAVLRGLDHHQESHFRRLLSAGIPRLHPYDDGASPKSTSAGENSSHSL